MLLAVSSFTAAGGNWPAWRGPDGSGISQETNVPLTWSAQDNVRWQVALPDRGNSTPIVWGQRVFITQAVLKENRRAVMCFDRRTGARLWQSGTTWMEREAGGSSNPPCTPSPATDGQRVVAWFGSAGVFCYDFKGRELWHRDLGRQQHPWGYAASPVLYRDRCFLNFGPGRRSALVALDKQTGKVLWRTDLPGISADAKWEEFGGDLNQWRRLGSPKMPDVSGSCATPLVVPVKTGDEIVLTLPLRVMAFAPQDGTRLWRCDGLNTGAYSSPFFGQGLIGVTGSGLRNAAMVIRPGGRGNVTATHRLWRRVPANSKSCIGSGLIDRGHIFLVTMMGFARCLELETGKVIWDERLTGSGVRNGSWSSPVLAAGRLYVANQNADVFVLRAAPQFACLATNSIGGEPMNASPAVSDGDIFLRTHRHLWCISAQTNPASPHRNQLPAAQ